MASKNVKLNLDHKTLLAVLQIALDGAVAQRSAAMNHHDAVSAGFNIEPGSGQDISRLMAIKEISESIEKYLKSADASIDKIIKIARLLADTMLRLKDEDTEELTEEDKEALRIEIQQMVSRDKDD